MNRASPADRTVHDTESIRDHLTNAGEPDAVDDVEIARDTGSNPQRAGWSGWNSSVHLATESAAPLTRASRMSSPSRAHAKWFERCLTLPAKCCGSHNDRTELVRFEPMRDHAARNSAHDIGDTA